MKLDPSLNRDCRTAYAYSGILGLKEKGSIYDVRRPYRMRGCGHGIANNGGTRLGRFMEERVVRRRECRCGVY